MARASRAPGRRCLSGCRSGRRPARSVVMSDPDRSGDGARLTRALASCSWPSTRSARLAAPLSPRLALAVLALCAVDAVGVVGAFAHLLDQGAEPLVLAHLGEVGVERLLAAEQAVEVGLDVGALAGVAAQLEQPGQEVDGALPARDRRVRRREAVRRLDVVGVGAQ